MTVNLSKMRHVHRLCLINLDLTCDFVTVLKIVKEFVEQAEKVLEQSENEDDTIDTVMPFVPGVCYTRLLAEVKETTVTG